MSRSGQKKEVDLATLPKKQTQVVIYLNLLEMPLQDLLQRMQKDKNLLVYANCDLNENLIGYLNTHDLAPLLETNRFFLKSMGEDEGEWLHLLKEVFLKEVEILSAKSASSEKMFVKDLLDKMRLCLYDFRDFGKSIFTNALEHTKRLENTYLPEGTENSLSNVPAIICGAGSSLAEQSELLKKASEKALIFAAGTSLLFLQKNSIPFHACALIDPSIEEEKRRALLEINSLFFYKLRLDPRVMDKVKGPKMLMPPSPGYPMIEYVYEMIANSQVSEESGWSVGNFLGFVAAKLGCSPIIFVGMDGGLIEGKEYAETIDCKVKKENNARVESIKGNPIQTRSDLLAAHSFFEDLKKAFPKTRFVNATVEGLQMKGIEHSPLDEVLQDLPKIDTQSMIAKVLSSAKKMHQSEKPFFEKALLSLSKAKKCIEELLLEMTKEKPNHGLLALYEIELEEEIAFVKILHPLFLIFEQMLSKNTEHKLLFYKECVDIYINALQRM